MHYPVETAHNTHQASKGAVIQLVSTEYNKIAYLSFGKLKTCP